MFKKLIFSLLILIFFLVNSLPAKCVHSESDFMVEESVGTLFAALIGPLFAFPRGMLKGGIIGTKAVARELGNENGRAQLWVGAFTGGIGGGILGMFASFLKAERDAFKYGLKDPWSTDSFSLAGDGILDYSPFDWEKY